MCYINAITGRNEVSDTTKTTIGSIVLNNPVICASGEHVLTEAGLRSAMDTGVGAVIAKSFNEVQAAKDQLERTDYALLDGNWKDRKSTRLNSSHSQQSRMPSSA